MYVLCVHVCVPTVYIAVHIAVNTTWNGSSSNLICLSQTLPVGHPFVLHVLLLHMVYWTSSLDRLVSSAGDHKLEMPFEAEADLTFLDVYMYMYVYVCMYHSVHVHVHGYMC